jgi:hypothetical protein
VYTQPAPTAFANIGWKYYLIFIIVPLCGVPILYMIAPETKGLSLEEIGACFGEEVALDITHMTPEERERLDKQVMESAVETKEDVTHVAKPATEVIERTEKV